MRAAAMVRVMGAALMALALIFAAGCGGDDEAAKAASDFVTAQTEFNNQAGSISTTLSTGATTNNMTGLAASTADGMAALNKSITDMKAAAQKLKDQKKTVALEIVTEAEAISGTLRDMIDVGEKGNIESFNALIAKYDVLVESFNSKVDEWNKLQSAS